MARNPGQYWPRPWPGLADLPTHKHYNSTDGGVLDLGSIPDAALGAGTPDGTKFLRGDRVWATPAGGGGGGGGGGPLDAAPDVPSAYDDEFEGGSLDDKWTEKDDPTGTGFTKTFGKYGSWLSLPNPGAATGTLWTFDQDVSGNFDNGTAIAVTARLAIRGAYGTNARAWIEISDNATHATNNTYCAGLQQNTATPRVEVFHNGSLVVTNNISVPSGAVWVQIRKTAGGALETWVSQDGLTWSRVHDTTGSWDVDYLRIRLSGHNATSSPTEPMIDCFRVNDSRAALP